MSKFKIGDYDYQIPGSGHEALEWEIARLKDQYTMRRVSRYTHEILWKEQVEEINRLKSILAEAVEVFETEVFDTEAPHELIEKMREASK